MAGKFIIDHRAQTVSFARNNNPVSVWEMAGIKVEALSGGAKNAPASRFSIGTDDERLGGIWRPVFGER